LVSLCLKPEDCGINLCGFPKGLILPARIWPWSGLRLLQKQMSGMKNSVFWVVTPCGFLQEPHGVTTQKTLFFIVTAVKTSNLKMSGIFPGVKRVGRGRLTTSPPLMRRSPRACGSLKVSQSCGPPQPCHYPETAQGTDEVAGDWKLRGHRLIGSAI
jgi:hypothetical protein